MKNNHLIFIIITFTLLAPSFIFAAPAPESFVINEQNKQCGIYWAGDEFKYNELPSGWKIYHPETRLVLKTPFGTCDFEYNNNIPDSKAQQEYYGQCCRTLGFNYIDHYENPLPYNNNTYEIVERQWYCSPEIGKEKYQGFLINSKTNDCRPLIGFNLHGVDRGKRTPTNEQCYITDNNWTPYEYLKNKDIYISTINTPFGNCSSSESIVSCCERLGLEYVDRDLVAQKTYKEIVNNIKDDKPKQYTFIIMAVLAVIIILMIFFSFFLIKRRQK